MRSLSWYHFLYKFDVELFEALAIVRQRILAFFLGFAESMYGKDNRLPFEPDYSLANGSQHNRNRPTSEVLNKYPIEWYARCPSTL